MSCMSFFFAGALKNTIKYFAPLFVVVISRGGFIDLCTFSAINKYEFVSSPPLWDRFFNETSVGACGRSIPKSNSNASFDVSSFHPAWFSFSYVICLYSFVRCVGRVTFLALFSALRFTDDVIGLTWLNCYCEFSYRSRAFFNTNMAVQSTL